MWTNFEAVERKQIKCEKNCRNTVVLFILFFLLFFNNKKFWIFGEEHSDTSQNWEIMLNAFLSSRENFFLELTI